jgi:hypothetical protein
MSVGGTLRTHCCMTSFNRRLKHIHLATASRGSAVRTHSSVLHRRTSPTDGGGLLLHMGPAPWMRQPAKTQKCSSKAAGLLRAAPAHRGRECACPALLVAQAGCSCALRCWVCCAQGLQLPHATCYWLLQTRISHVTHGQNHKEGSKPTP